MQRRKNCRVYTRSGKAYSGTFQLKNASIHVNGSYNDTARSYDAMEVVLDEPVESKADTEALGILTGDIVCFDPRTTMSPPPATSRAASSTTSSPCRHPARLWPSIFTDTGNQPQRRKVYQPTSPFMRKSDTAAPLRFPADVADVHQQWTWAVWARVSTAPKRQVSICCKGLRRPLSATPWSPSSDRRSAHREQADFAVDVYPHYGSDAEAGLRSGIDCRHGLIGSGVYASHGYERSHVKGVMENTFRLLKAHPESGLIAPERFLSSTSTQEVM